MIHNVSLTQKPHHIHQYKQKTKTKITNYFMNYKLLLTNRNK